MILERNLIEMPIFFPLKGEKIKDCSLIYSSFRPNFAPMEVYHALNDGEADARSHVLALWMEALEHAKEPVIIFHTESCAVIPNTIDRFFPVRLFFDLCFGLFRFLVNFTAGLFLLQERACRGTFLRCNLVLRL